jgi:hypothetical protein
MLNLVSLCDCEQYQCNIRHAQEQAAMGFSLEFQCTLSAFTLRIAHAINTDSLSWMDVGHILRSDQYILLLIAIVGGVDLCANHVKNSIE